MNPASHLFRIHVTPEQLSNAAPNCSGASPLSPPAPTSSARYSIPVLPIRILLFSPHLFFRSLALVCVRETSPSRGRFKLLRALISTLLISSLDFPIPIESAAVPLLLSAAVAQCKAGSSRPTICRTTPYFIAFELFSISQPRTARMNSTALRSSYRVGKRQIQLKRVIWQELYLAKRTPSLSMGSQSPLDIISSSGLRGE